MPNLNDYQTEHLFLLIGGNPLPNYVAAKLLAKKAVGKPTLHLIYSLGEEGTEKYATKLSDVLSENNYEIKKLPILPSRQYSIYNCVKNRVSGLINNGETSIGINYTGGTKAMAVHAYRAIKEIVGETNEKRNTKIKPVFSYLDSREMKMCIDQAEDKDRIEFKLYDSNQNYFKATEIWIDGLLALHGLEKKQDFRTTAKHQEVMKAVYQEFTDNLVKWELFRGRINNGQQISLDGLSFLPKVLSDMSLAENGGLDFTKFTDGKESKEFRDYLNGKWLEDFVLERILNVRKDFNQELGECGASLEIKHPKNVLLPYFEADCFVMRGYQLFIISCAYITTTQSLAKKKNSYKQKIFEILSRAEQIGGSEARVALVCMASNSENHRGELVDLVDTLEKELDDNRIKIFGKEDVLDKNRFDNKLREWFEKR
jgi:hypothetical protein